MVTKKPISAPRTIRPRWLQAAWLVTVIVLANAVSGVAWGFLWPTTLTERTPEGLIYVGSTPDVFGRWLLYVVSSGLIAAIAGVIYGIRKPGKSGDSSYLGSGLVVLVAFSAALGSFMFFDSAALVAQILHPLPAPALIQSLELGTQLEVAIPISQWPVAYIFPAFLGALSTWATLLYKQFHIA
ncbi:hypothetical protein [Corynebacterium caspium]|uniref:hypothetical protein n=1 Tax=Corynebacterium caspium TaxID=234828 RepID=UPI0003701F4D|nr:hypothetical protein [Corynebacterium caspium]WKD59028.1 hypothetical protein CCASP_03120 [Corynebacterium caspium DSM 44850]